MPYLNVPTRLNMAHGERSVKRSWPSPRCGHPECWTSRAAKSFPGTREPPPESEARVTTEQSPRQPWLHDLRIIVDGNATALSASTGDMCPGAGHGLFVDDV